MVHITGIKNHKIDFEDRVNNSEVCKMLSFCVFSALIFNLQNIEFFKD